MKIYNRELPNITDLYDRIMALHSMKGTDKQELSDEATFFLGATKIFIADYEEYMAEEIYGSDPARTIMDLESYDMMAAALTGLAEALYHKYRAGVYEQLTVESNGTDNKKKLAQGDRAEFARGETAAIEGSQKTVEALHRNIQERLSNLKQKRSRY